MAAPSEANAASRLLPIRPTVPPGSRPVAESIFEDFPDRPRLVGSTCAACGATTFPARGSCPSCTGQDTSPTALPAVGTLWGFTIQGFPPKEPYLGAGGPFTPFGVGYVDLGSVLVESRLLADDLTRLEVDLPMELVLEPLTVAATGEVVVGFAFTPTGAPPADPPADAPDTPDPPRPTGDQS